METFDVCLLVMALLGVVVFVALYFVDAGYGKLISPRWGPTVPNKLGWALMECPVFFVMLALWATSGLGFKTPWIVFLLLFELHYFHRSFVFPFLMRGRSRMPVAIVAMSIVFNLANGYLQGWWLFRLAPEQGYYGPGWLMSPQFIAGTVLFFAGMFINRQSDSIISHLRKPGDTRHYLPHGGLYDYVTSANYLGEIIEWLGWAVLTWSLAGLVFFWFTCANLVPRSNAIWHRYREEFPSGMGRRKRIFPFIY